MFAFNLTWMFGTPTSSFVCLLAILALACAYAWVTHEAAHRGWHFTPRQISFVFLACFIVVVIISRGLCSVFSGIEMTSTEEKQETKGRK